MNFQHKLRKNVYKCFKTTKTKKNKFNHEMHSQKSLLSIIPLRGGEREGGVRGDGLQITQHICHPSKCFITAFDSPRPHPKDIPFPSFR